VAGARPGVREQGRDGAGGRHVRRALRIILKRACLAPEEWTPRELRHSFMSLMSLFGVSVEEIADLVGHAGRFNAVGSGRVLPVCSPASPG
jgi:integrase